MAGGSDPDPADQLSRVPLLKILITSPAGSPARPRRRPSRARDDQAAAAAIGEAADIDKTAAQIGGSARVATPLTACFL